MEIDIDNILILIILVACSVVLGGFAEAFLNRENLVGQGHAEYYLDEKNKRRWRMFPPKHIQSGDVITKPFFDDGEKISVKFIKMDNGIKKLCIDNEPEHKK